MLDWTVMVMLSRMYVTSCQPHQDQIVWIQHTHTHIVYKPGTRSACLWFMMQVVETWLLKQCGCWWITVSSPHTSSSWACSPPLMVKHKQNSPHTTGRRQYASLHMNDGIMLDSVVSGVSSIVQEFPEMTILTTEVHSVAPTHFGQKYFGTEWLPVERKWMGPYRSSLTTSVSLRFNPVPNHLSGTTVYRFWPLQTGNNLQELQFWRCSDHHNAQSWRSNIYFVQVKPSKKHQTLSSSVRVRLLVSIKLKQSIISSHKGHLECKIKK